LTLEIFNFDLQTNYFYKKFLVSAKYEPIFLQKRFGEPIKTFLKAKIASASK